MNKCPIEPSRLLFDANGVCELDRLAIEDEGIAGILLMKRAGKAVFSAIRKTWPYGGAARCHTGCERTA